jgi:hypothetical protein
MNDFEENVIVKDKNELIGEMKELIKEDKKDEVTEDITATENAKTVLKQDESPVMKDKDKKHIAYDSVITTDIKDVPAILRKDPRNDA